MRFSLYSQLMDPTGNRVYADLLDQLKEQTALCEQAGFHCVWIDEHHFLGGENCSTNPSLTGSMLAAHTQHIRIGQTNVAGCWQPLRLAEDVALLDHISRGRVEVGLGRGINPFDVANLNPQLKGLWPDPLARFDTTQQSPSRDHLAEFVEVLRKAWTEEFFSYQGAHFQFPHPGFPWRHSAPPSDPSAVRDGEIVKMCVRPKPYQKPHPPLWMLMSSEPSFAEAAKLDLNGLVWIQPPRRLRERLEIYRQIRSERENCQLTVGQNVGALRMVYVAKSYEEAKRDADSFFTPLYEGSSRRRPASYWFDGEEATAKSLDLDWEFFRQQLLILAGSPEQVIEQIQELDEVCGMDHLLVWTETMGMDHRKIMASLGLFAEKVAPAFAY